MFDHRLRSLKDRLLFGLIERLGLALPPTTVTLIGLAIGLLGVALTAAGFFWAGLILWGLNRLFDGLDGALARQHDQQSDLGGYMDILADFVIYAGYPIAVVVADGTPERYLALALLLASFYINTVSWAYLAALLEKRAQGAHSQDELTSVTMPSGLVGGTETVIFYVLFLLMPAWITPLFVLMTLLVVMTILQRLRWAIRTL